MSFKSILKSLISSAINQVLDASQTQKSSQATATNPTPAPKQATVQKNTADIPGTKAKIENALNQLYGFSYKKEVSALEISAAAHPASKPVSFLVFSGESPVLAIMAVTSNTYRSMPVVGTTGLLEERGIPFIRFFAEYDNKDDYVLNRIKEHL